jgi:urease gamma subunit
MDRGIIMWAAFLILIVAGMLVSRKMKKGINENGIETDAVISRISEDMSQDLSDFIVYAKYRTEDGEEVEGVISNPRTDLEEGQQVRIKYHPKYKTNARLV